MRSMYVLGVAASSLLAMPACSPAASGGTDGGHGSNGDGGGNVGDAGTLPDGSITPTGDVTIIVEPNGNKGAELVTAINAATTSVYMTMYEIDDANVLTALVNAASTKHLDVQAVLDSSTTNKTSNTPAYNQLNTAGAKAVWSSSAFTFTHEKTVIIDGKTAWIMTMNLNTSSPEYNREYLAIDTSPADVTEATAIFKADHALQSITPSGDLVVADTNARTSLVALINTATRTLDLEVEEFSDTYSTGITNAVVAAAKRHVAVRLVIANETSPEAAQTTSVGDVKTAGGKVVVTGPTSGEGTAANPYIHAKAITVDCTGTACTTGFVGSENFTGGSLGYNRELGLILNDPAQLAKVEAAINTDFSNGTAQ